MSDRSFPTSHRLLNASQFDQVFSEPDVRISRAELLILAKRNFEGFNRLGMVIGKKNFPKAVTRNALKRTIREVFRHLPLAVDSPVTVPEDQVELTSCYDVIVLGRKAATSDKFRDVLEKAFAELQRKPSSRKK